MEKKIGDYSILNIVGQGAFGKALLVKDASGEKMIMKLINTQKMSKGDIEDAKKEVQVLIRLTSCPFTVTYRKAFADRYLGIPHLCIVMDYCSGGDLLKLIRERKKQGRKFSETTLRTWLLQITASIEYMHRHKILHRDLKPANIFLDSNNYIQVGDLGLSKILEFTMQQAKTHCGTPAYMAPELCQGKPYQMPADIWAIGCIMYEAAAFDLPFKGSNFLELNRNICKGSTPKIPQSYSDELRTICENMLNKDPLKRPTAKEVLESPCLAVEYSAYIKSYRD